MDETHGPSKETNMTELIPDLDGDTKGPLLDQSARERNKEKKQIKVLLRSPSSRTSSQNQVQPSDTPAKRQSPSKHSSSSSSGSSSSFSSSSSSSSKRSISSNTQSHASEIPPPANSVKARSSHYGASFIPRSTTSKKRKAPSDERQVRYYPPLSSPSSSSSSISKHTSTTKNSTNEKNQSRNRSSAPSSRPSKKPRRDDRKPPPQPPPSTEAESSSRRSLSSDANPLLSSKESNNAPPKPRRLSPKAVACRDAIRSGSLDDLKKLLMAPGGRGAVNETDDLGRTALHEAVFHGRGDMAAALLDVGADISVVDNENQTPLGVAVNCGHEFVTLYLLNRITCDQRFDTRDTFGRHLLHVAIQKGFVGIAHSLIWAKVDLNAKTNYGDTPLHFAVQNSQPDILSVLLGAKAQINIPNEDGKTPLHLAVEQGAVSVVTTLLAHGGSPSIARTADLFTPLHLAVQLRNFQVTVALLNAKRTLPNGEQSSDPLYVKDRWGRTPLHLALEVGFHEIAYVLLRETTRSDRETPMPPLRMEKKSHKQDSTGQCDESGRKKASQELRQDTVDSSYPPPVLTWTPLQFSAYYGYSEFLEELLEVGVDLETKDENHRTALHLCVRQGNVPMARLLLDHGADIEAKNDLNQTPLHIAIKYGHEQMVLYLLRKGASVTPADVQEYTPLHRVVKQWCLQMDEDSNNFELDMDRKEEEEEEEEGTEQEEEIERSGGKGGERERPTYKPSLPIESKSQRKYENMARALGRYGANFRAKNENEHTPAEIADFFGYESIVRILQDIQQSLPGRN